MANELRGLCIGFYTASADLSAKQYRFAKVSGNKTLTVAAAGTDELVGVIQNAPASGAAVDLMVSGISKIIVGTGGCVAGGKAMSDANGGAITATTNTGANRSVGTFMTTNNAGEVAELLLGTTAVRL